MILKTGLLIGLLGISTVILKFRGEVIAYDKFWASQGENK